MSELQKVKQIRNFKHWGLYTFGQKIMFNFALILDFRYTTDAVSPYLDWKQSISAYGVISMGQFLINGQSFLVVLDTEDVITVYKFNGIRFFEKVHAISVSGKF